MTVNLVKVDSSLSSLAELIKKKQVKKCKGNLNVGVDLGTANIVLTVVDDDGNAVAGALYPANVVRDGLLIDYIGAVNIVKKLKKDIEKSLNRELTKAATAVPPGTIGGNLKSITNVLEAAEFEVTGVVDEPIAATTTLNVTDGAVVDIGGGTTGISIIENGKVIYTADEPTGGTHMSLVISGSYKIPFQEADKLKKNPSKKDEISLVIKPVIEKMATIVKKHIVGSRVDKIYVVGGASSVKGVEKVFFEETGIEVVKPDHPLLITPLGIALCSMNTVFN